MVGFGISLWIWAQVNKPRRVASGISAGRAERLWLTFRRSRDEVGAAKLELRCVIAISSEICGNLGGIVHIVHVVHCASLLSPIYFPSFGRRFPVQIPTCVRKEIEVKVRCDRDMIVWLLPANVTVAAGGDILGIGYNQRGPRRSVRPVCAKKMFRRSRAKIVV